jgi:hypothetical protein
MNVSKVLLSATLALALPACGDDTSAETGAGGGGGDQTASSSSTSASSTTASGTSSASGSGATSGSTSSSSGAGGADECGNACEAGTSCQLCFEDGVREGSYDCARLDPEPTADEFRCGEENCARSAEICISGDYVFDEVVCGEPERCRPFARCDDCACAIENMNGNYCMKSCTDDGNGAIVIGGSDLSGSDCMNCLDPGEPCTGESRCCGLDGLDAFCNEEGVCEEGDGSEER